MDIFFLTSVSSYYCNYSITVGIYLELNDQIMLRSPDAYLHSYNSVK